MEDGVECKEIRKGQGVRRQQYHLRRAQRNFCPRTRDRAAGPQRTPFHPTAVHSLWALPGRTVAIRLRRGLAGSARLRLGPHGRRTQAANDRTPGRNRARGPGPGGGVCRALSALGQAAAPYAYRTVRGSAHPAAHRCLASCCPAFPDSAARRCAQRQAESDGAGAAPLPGIGTSAPLAPGGAL
eukprot:282323-Hanusia_phi.AAC.1